MTETSASSISLKSAGCATTLVTVTYADRIHYLEVLLERAFEVEGVARVIIVSNASRSDLSLLERRWGDQLQVIRLSANTGSANGYAVGIRAALAQAASMIWLMDDDNAPRQGALALLQNRLRASIPNVGEEQLAVLGFRPEHQADVAAGLAENRAVPPRSSFFGFHYRQIFFKIRRRLTHKQSSGVNQQIVQLAYAPYGGLLASRKLFEKIGLPKTELVLYADDTEYTRRITSAGGKIELVTAAELEDLEGSWNLKEKYSNTMLGWLQGGSNFRAFYASRNQAWFDRHIWMSSNFSYIANQFIYLFLLRIFAIKTGRFERYRLLRAAITQGKNGDLGISERYPL